MELVCDSANSMRKIPTNLVPSPAKAELPLDLTGPHITAGSPLQHASAIQVPVLLVHGDLDSNVRAWHSQKMAAALKGAGKQVDFLEYKNLDHQLEDSGVRQEFLTRMGELLDRTIGH